MTGQTLTEQGFDLIFRAARTANGWQDRLVEEELLRKIYDDMKFGPTSANCCPLRIVFVKSPEAKARLKPCLAPGNVEKTMAAPVCAILAQDMRFHERLPELFPHADAKSWFEGNDALIASTAFRNSSLQGAYFMIAARAHGLDCGPMSGFDAEKLDAEFFPDGRFKVNFICSLGYADPSKTFARSPRLPFDDACKIV
ncbi:MAG: malonic semialdehyde reductase [Alphaproteobacteria bacterium]|nr:malonic semialdehyde reductase [Alphaproteobacteria bacterium]